MTPDNPVVAVVRKGGIVYGKVQGLALRVYELDLKGTPHATEERVHFSQDELRETSWWRGGITGISEATFPQPERWRLADIDKPLDKIGVRDMTRAFARRVAKEPSCKRNWDKAVGEVNWEAVGKRYKVGLCAPTDFGTHYKCIAHRQFQLRRGDDGDQCRLCGGSKETLAHFGECPRLKGVFNSLRTVDEGSKWNDARLNLLGVKGRGVVKKGVSAVHMMMWKHVIPELVRTETKGAEFQTKQVLARAARRYLKREGALKVRVKLYMNKCEARGLKPRMDTFNSAVDGIAEVTEDGELIRGDNLQKWIDDCNEAFED
jgi:hypothetical protein